MTETPIKCHKTIRTEQLGAGQTRYIVCNRDLGHKGKCNTRGERYTGTLRDALTARGITPRS